ncbi:MAG: Peptidylprolyl isomerase [Pedosphaera sp.]|nr:Peptidylprolyl isomerase [Pedosphaera sp.]
MSGMKYFSTMVLAGAVFCSAISARAELANGIQAIVNDSIVTYQQVEMYTAQGEEFLRQQYGKQPQEYQKRLMSMRNQGLENLVTRQLVLQDFKSSGFHVPESIIDDIVQERVRARFQDRVELTKKLQSEGLTFESFRKEIRDQLIFDEMRRKYVPEPIISPHKIEAYYQGHAVDFKVADQVKYRVMVFNRTPTDTDGTTKKRAEEIVTQLKDGATFADMAKTYSEGPTRNEGGEVGWQELSVVNKALVEHLAKLKAAEYSGVIETPEAYFIIQLEERKPSHIKPLNDVRDDIEKNLMVQESNRKQEEWIARLKKKTFIRYF